MKSIYKISLNSRDCISNAIKTDFQANGIIKIQPQTNKAYTLIIKLSKIQIDREALHTNNEMKRWNKWETNEIVFKIGLIAINMHNR